MAVLVGSGVQFLYFKSIGHVPSDLAALTTLAISTTAAAALSLFALAFLIALPSIVARMYVEDASTTTTPFALLEVVCAQVVALCIVLVWGGAAHASDCQSPLTALTYGSLVVGLASLGYMARIYARKPIRGPVYLRAWYSFLIILLSVPPLSVLLVLMRVLDGSWEADLAFFSLWLLATALNAGMATSRATQGTVFMAWFAVTCCLFVVLPLGFGKSDRLGASLAEGLGVRSESAVDLLLPEKACLVVQAAQLQVGGSAISCKLQEGNPVRAQILSNVGSRWVLALDAKSSNPGAESAKREVKVTVPADGIQLFSGRSPEQVKPPRCRAG